MSLLAELEQKTKIVIKKTVDECPYGFALCLSGGVDSSLLLAILCSMGKKPTCITIGNSKNHPDVIAAKKVTKLFKVPHEIFILQPLEICRYKELIREKRQEYFVGDEAVYILFQKISQLGFMSVFATDGIDELMGGYWQHHNLMDFNYFLSRLWSCHLKPLLESANEFGIRVLFPYLDYELADFISREVPLSEKTKDKQRKIMWKELALKYLPEEIVNRKKYGECDALSWISPQ